jgi:septal ring factor EnvC (AmiA/AmiB activator)
MPTVNPSSHPTPKNTQESLAGMQQTRQSIAAIQKDLTGLVDKLHHNHSLINRAAHFWGRLSIWQKGAIGVVLLGTIALSIWLNIAAVIVVTSLVAAFYLGSGFLLSNHYKATKQAMNGVQEKMARLSTMLADIILGLEALHQKLKTEITHFTEENRKLTENVSQLKEEITTFSGSMKDLTGIKEKLASTEAKLATLTEEYRLLYTAFEEKVKELAGVRSEMGLEVERLKVVGATLQGTVETLSGTVLHDKAQQEAFQKKLSDFLDSSSTSFDKVAERICEAERELVTVKAALELSNLRYSKLIDRYASQVSRLEKISSQAAKRYGLFGRRKPLSMSPEKPSSQDDIGIHYKI